MNTNTPTLIEIVDEALLGDHCEAHIDEHGNLCIVQDETLPEEAQTYVSLNAQQTRALVAFLKQSNVASLY